ncbi:uncharacterized protein BX664DRAFT_296123 [Halteromyces radiatus]|uniref:uncharacterized protein n=1 Tax=Halteromyces radiatus TaxID=101107 RepID=UPI0022202DBC|nr:uncharacterized protein BX664DRAFT_296123 [Halteromyces radiatus]KAI8088778.1 hypothetical protein BX664DRAFT_296123 [Halteromyces radiatus]
MQLKRRWLNQHSPTFNDTHSLLLSLPKELLFQIITNVANSPCVDNLYPQSLIELSKCCHYLHHLIHYDPWRFNTLWPNAFHERFDTRAIYRRRLDGWDWQKVMKLRCKALYACKAFASQPTDCHLLDAIRWEIIWDMITEHDERNIPHLLNYNVHSAAVAAFQLDQHRDRKLFPVVLPILSLLVNYDFNITSHFRAPIQPNSAQIVSTELSRFAYNFEAADSLITKHMPLRPFHASAQHGNETPTDDELPLTFYPALDAPAAALHLFFTTFFASHPSLYSIIPGCIPIPLFQISSDMFDVEYLRRYERNLFINSHVDDQTRKNERPWVENVTTLPSNNIYANTGFASPSHFVSEAHHIEGDWLGYYSFVDPEDVATEAEDWFDGPMRLSIRIVPLEDHHHHHHHHHQSSNRHDAFPSMHLQECPLTKFEGTGVDNLGSFTVVGLIDDTEDGQVTWEKTYVESGETWEYSGRFALPMGICGRWGDEEYGGPWWMWKTSNCSNSESVLTSYNIK